MGIALSLRGKPIGLIKESGILEDYSSNFILLRQVVIRDPDFLAFWENRTVKKGKVHFSLYSRKPR